MISYEFIALTHPSSRGKIIDVNPICASTRFTKLDDMNKILTSERIAPNKDTKFRTPAYVTEKKYT